jgi:hypothetical protein
MKLRFPPSTGVLAFSFALRTAAASRFVDLNNAAPAFPYTSWVSAAANIQDAVDAAQPGEEILVTNGVYASGGRVVYGALTNRVVLDKAVLVQSVNGPALTVIQGHQVPGSNDGDEAVRCVYLTNGAVLSGFTLTGGAPFSAIQSNLVGLAGSTVASDTNAPGPGPFFYRVGVQ